MSSHSPEASYPLEHTPLAEFELGVAPCWIYKEERTECRWIPVEKKRCDVQVELSY
jgi:hypothetical protein